MNSLLNQAARRVKDNIVLEDNKDQEVFIDPATIMLIASILSVILNAIRLWCEIKRNKKEQSEGEQICSICRNPSVAQKWMVNGAVRRQTRGQLNARQRKELRNAIFNTGATANPQEIEKLINEVVA